MVRSMFSGVSGLRTHQTRMDTIGNNIANVNTYGYKSTRATFRDIYYQSMSSASGPTAAQGGVNPVQVGYGTQVNSIDLMMGQSTFSMTDQTMDLAIDGDGFFQVQDAAGNTYYTRAGMLNFDADGNLVDMQGNFVLGVNGDPTGRDPGSEKIRVNLPAVNPAAGSAVQMINGKEFTISASNNTVDSNVNFNFTSSSDMADDVKATATVTTTGIVINFNANYEFSGWAEVNKAINDAIVTGNSGKEHAGGTYSVAYSGPSAQDPFAVAGGKLKGSELTSTDYGTQYGKLNLNATGELSVINPSGTVGAEFGSAFGTNTSGVTAYTAALVAGGGGAPDYWEVSMTINGQIYKGQIDANKADSGKFNLYLDGDPATNPKDFVEMKRPSYDEMNDVWSAANGGAAPAPGATLGTTALSGTATASGPSFNVGLSSTGIKLTGGTEGGAQTLADMTGIGIASNGVIIGLDSQGTEIIIGRIDLATFDNAEGLTQAGSTTYMQSANSGVAKVSTPGTNGAGQLVGGTLELSNVDLSREFSDMITTQRGYQANSRIITVSDTMLEELINLKR